MRVGRGAAVSARAALEARRARADGHPVPRGVWRRGDVVGRLLHLHRGAGARRSVGLRCPSPRTTGSAPRTSRCSAPTSRSSTISCRSRRGRAARRMGTDRGVRGQRCGARCARPPSRDGDCWVINGTKQFITHGRTGDLIVVMAVTNKSQGQPRHLRVHRRAGHARLPRRQEGRQARHARERDERSDLRELPRAGGAAARRRKARGSSTRCRCSTPAASASRRWPSASRRAPTKPRGATRSSASSSASRSAPSRASARSWSTTPRASRRRGC